MLNGIASSLWWSEATVPFFSSNGKPFNCFEVHRLLEIVTFHITVFRRCYWTISTSIGSMIVSVRGAFFINNITLYWLQIVDKKNIERKRRKNCEAHSIFLLLHCSNYLFMIQTFFELELCDGFFSLHFFIQSGKLRWQTAIFLLDIRLTHSRLRYDSLLWFVWIEPYCCPSVCFMHIIFVVGCCWNNCNWLLARTRDL